MTVENRGGVQTQYSYDRSNRLLTEIASDAMRTTMLYDGDGRVAGVMSCAPRFLSTACARSGVLAASVFLSAREAKSDDASSLRSSK